MITTFHRNGFLPLTRLGDVDSKRTRHGTEEVTSQEKTKSSISRRNSMPVEQALEAFMTRRYERCKTVVEGSLAIGRWEQDHSLPIDPDATRAQVSMSAAMPI